MSEVILRSFDKALERPTKAELLARLAELFAVEVTILASS